MFDHPGVWNKIVKFIILLNHYCSCGTMFVASMGKPFPRIYIPTNVYTSICLIYIKIATNKITAPLTRENFSKTKFSFRLHTRPSMPFGGGVR